MKDNLEVVELYAADRVELRMKVEGALNSHDTVVSINLIENGPYGYKFWVTICRNLSRAKITNTHDPKCDVNPLTGTWRRNIPEGLTAYVCSACYNRAKT